MVNLEDVKNLMARCVEIGFVKGQTAMSPQSDRIRRAEAQRLLASNGYQKVILRRWVSAGLVDEHKGERNSPIWYSRLQLVSVMGTMDCKDFLDKSKIID